MKNKVKTNRTKKTVRKSPRRRKKMRPSDTLRAFLLVAALVAFSAVISFAVIQVYSRINNGSLTDIDIARETESAVTVITESTVTPSTAPVNDTKIDIIVSTQAAQDSVTTVQPSRTTTAAPSQSTPAATNTAPARPAPAVTPTATAPTAMTAPATTVTPSTVTVVPQPSSTTVPASTSTVVQPRQAEGTLVFVIDDAGNNLRELEPFLRIPGPLTIAVLPGLPHSAEAAKRIRAAGKEVILHQPMEAIGGQDPGPGAIYSGMSADEIRTILARNIAEVGPVTGMNNHQGSKITMDREAMETILAFCVEHNIYFLDSRTTADSVVASVASQMGIEIAERNVFIDNEQSRESMLRYISTGLARARRNGIAVMIGHTWSPALAPLLTEQFPIFMEQGYTIKTAFDIIKSR